MFRTSMVRGEGGEPGRAGDIMGLNGKGGGPKQLCLHCGRRRKKTMGFREQREGGLVEVERRRTRLN